MKYKVIIGLCVKNAENVIQDALEGILNQDFPHDKMEIIVVDGYSRDRTVRAIKNLLTKASIKTRFFNENKGLGFARQIVVENAEGDYVIWVDADIILSRGYIKKQIEFMEKNPKVGVAGGTYGLYPGRTLISAFENISYFVDSVKHRGGIYPRLLGTEGSIFRVEAVKEAGGFDCNIKGAGEDTDLVLRIKKAGWIIYMTKAVFYEKCKETWRELWNQYVWWGFGGHYLFHKYRRISPLYELSPPAGFAVGLIRSFFAYRLTHRKIFFLLPFHYLFKRIAWWYGFMKADLENYGYSNQQFNKLLKKNCIKF